MTSNGIISKGEAKPAPDWAACAWINGNGKTELADYRGQVLAIYAFQMLCPGCVYHGIPQMERLRSTFSEASLAVVGLHTVFEHHESMRPSALKDFIHEYRISYPVGVDEAQPNTNIPITMDRYQMRGTPTLILIDAEGLLRYHAFGRPSDMEVARHVAELIAEAAVSRVDVEPTEASPTTSEPTCTPDGCAIPNRP